MYSFACGLLQLPLTEPRRTENCFKCTRCFLTKTWHQERSLTLTLKTGSYTSSGIRHISWKLHATCLVSIFFMALQNGNEWTEFLESAGITDGTNVLESFHWQWLQRTLINGSGQRVVDSDRRHPDVGSPTCHPQVRRRTSAVDLCSTHHKESFRHCYVKYRVIQNLRPP